MRAPTGKKKGRPGWPESEVEFLRQNAKRMPASMIARHIGRTTDAVTSKAYALRLKLLVPYEDRALRREAGRVYFAKRAASGICLRCGQRPVREVSLYKVPRKKPVLCEECAAGCRVRSVQERAKLAKAPRVEKPKPVTMQKVVMDTARIERMLYLAGYR